MLWYAQRRLRKMERIMLKNQASIYSYDVFKHKQIVALELRALTNRVRKSLGITYPVGIPRKPTILSELRAIKTFLSY